MNEKVSIIIVHYEEPEYLNILLQSIKICSVNNEYEVIIVDNNSTSNISIDYFNKIQNQENITIIRSSENIGFAKALSLGIEKVSEDSTYLVFSHSDNVVLSKEWLDFLIGQEIDNPKTGALCVGPLMSYTGPGGQERKGPNYNFLFTKKTTFLNLNRFATKDCNNVGLFLGYQFQLQEINKEVIMCSPMGFIHHYSLKKVSQNEKVEDIKIFNKFFVERISK